MKYHICIVEHRSTIVEIESKSEKSALKIAQEAYHNDYRLKNMLSQDEAIEANHIYAIKEAKVGE